MFWGTAQTTHDSTVMFESVCHLASDLIWLPALARLVRAAEACLAVPASSPPPPTSPGATEPRGWTASTHDTQVYTELVVALHAFLKPAASGNVEGAAGGGGGLGRNGRRGGAGSGGVAGFAKLAGAAQALFVGMEQVTVGVQAGVSVTVSPDAPAEHPRAKARATLAKVVANLLRKTKSGTQNLPPSVWRRITYFCSSLDMPMPTFVRTDQIRSWGTLTPYVGHRPTSPLVHQPTGPPARQLASPSIPHHALCTIDCPPST